VGIPSPTTKAILKSSVKKRDNITKRSPKRIFEETKFRRFFIQTDVSVYVSKFTSGYFDLNSFKISFISFTSSIAFPSFVFLISKDTFGFPLKWEICSGVANPIFTSAISLR